jgi:hypothetical protein
VGAGFGIAWKLGAMERKINDLVEDVHDLKDRLERLR